MFLKLHSTSENVDVHVCASQIIAITVDPHSDATRIVFAGAAWTIYVRETPEQIFHMIASATDPMGGG